MTSESLLLSAIAGPYFLAGIILELRAARRRGVRIHHLPDTITNLACGALQQTLAVPTRIWVFGAYAFIQQRFGLFSISSHAVWAWPFAFLVVDHQYYWFHRASHRVSFLWAAHEVHHQSEEYNLTTALRQSAVQECFVAPMYWPLALLGFPVEMLIACVVASALYQFWIHTTLVGRLPSAFEAIFNTPSQHRVHHAVDPEYIDKNYAGTLAVWDRLYGTWRKEREPPTFGTVEPLARFSVLAANVAGWSKILAHARRAGGLAKLYAFVAPPEWTPDGRAAIPEARGRAKYRVSLRGPIRSRLVLAIATVSALVGVAGARAERVGALRTLPLTALLVAACVGLGMVIERRKSRDAPRFLR